MTRAAPVTAARELPAPSVVEFTDRGVGFTLQQAAPRALADAARHLLDTTVQQPMIDTGRHPVRGLHHLPEQELWCYAVQGRGGPFGAAGTCQFVFADAASWQPGELWLWCAARSADGRFRPDLRPVATLPPGGDTGVATEVLHGLADGLARIGLGHDPRAAECLLGGLLPALPVDVVARYSWTTCLLARPAAPNQPMIAGRWPGDLRIQQPSAAAAIDTWLGERRSLPGVAPLTRGDRERRALDALAGRVVSGPRFRGPAGVTGIAGLLDTVATTLLPVDDELVARMLAGSAPPDRLRDAADEVTGWAHRHPQDARPHVARGTGGTAVRSALLAGMWSAAVDGRDELYLPPATEPEPGWHALVAEAIRQRRTGPEEIAEDFLALRDAAVAYTSEAECARARDWLLSLGLSEEISPALFPDVLGPLQLHFAETGELDDDDRAALSDPRRDLLGELVALAPYAADHWPHAAATLVDVLLQNDRAADADALVVALLAPPQIGAAQVERLLGAVPEGRARGAVARRGLELLRRQDTAAHLSDELVRSFAAALAEDPAVDREIRYVLARQASAAPGSKRPAEEPVAAEDDADSGPDGLASTRRRDDHGSRLRRAGDVVLKVVIVAVVAFGLLLVLVPTTVDGAVPTSFGDLRAFWTSVLEAPATGPPASRP